MKVVYLYVGSGTGSMARQIAAKYKCQVLGIDSEKEQVQIANDAAATDGVSHLTRFEICDASQLNANDQEPFDVVMCRLFLCQLTDKFVKEGVISYPKMNRVLEKFTELETGDYKVGYFSMIQFVARRANV